MTRRILFAERAKQQPLGDRALPFLRALDQPDIAHFDDETLGPVGRTWNGPDAAAQARRCARGMLEQRVANRIRAREGFIEDRLQVACRRTRPDLRRATN